MARPYENHPLPDPLDAAADPMLRLRAVMARLRDPATGCPWDIEQSFATIAPYTIEEAYEVADAIEREAWDELPGELGDLLLQAVYHAQMAEEKGLFGFDDIARKVTDKMILRHPHIWGNESRDRSADDQADAWERVKAAERAGRAETGVLDGVAPGLPALLRAVKLQNRAARVGFDWPDISGVLEKMTEEASEIAEARDTLGPEALTEEVGDLLFVMANFARHLGVDPEAALRAANQKFIRRFGYIETRLAAQGRSPAQSDPAEMDTLWNEVRRADKVRSG